MNRTRNLLEELIKTLKDNSSQKRISQLETLTTVASKLDVYYCNPMKLVKVKLTKISRSEFRENTADTKKLTEKTSNEKYKNRMLENIIQRFRRNAYH